MSEIFNAQLREEILKMVDVDQKMRASENWDSSVDHRNTARMKEIVTEIGWPTIPQVGEDGSNGAWLLVQHADHDRDFQKYCLGLLNEAVKGGSASTKNLAYLTDRVAVSSGEPQIYGTQFYIDDETKEFKVRPIKDRAALDQLRSSVGLEPFADYEKRMVQTQRKLNERNKG